MPARRIAPVLPTDKRFGPGPALGRDVPFTISADGVPLPDLEYRVVDYGVEYGIRHETKCPHCGRWLSYGERAEAATIYLRCEDHRAWENGPLSW